MESDGSMECILMCHNGLEWLSKFLKSREVHRTRILMSESNPLGEYLLKVSPLPPMEYDGSMGCILARRKSFKTLSKFLNSREHHRMRTIKFRQPLASFEI